MDKEIQDGHLGIELLFSTRLGKRFQIFQGPCNGGKNRPFMTVKAFDKINGV